LLYSWTGANGIWILEDECASTDIGSTLENIVVPGLEIVDSDSASSNGWPKEDHIGMNQKRWRIESIVTWIERLLE
jgi:hypothetical protein